MGTATKGSRLPSAVVRELEEAEPRPTQDQIAEATEIFNKAAHELAMVSNLLISMLMSICRVVWTEAAQKDVGQDDTRDELEKHGTFFVTLTGDGMPLLGVSPRLAIRFGKTGTAFGLAHEMMHLLLRHLYTDPQLNNDETWITACEITINDYVLKLLKMSGLPTVIGADGKPTPYGIDPRKVYDEYVADLKKQGKEPVSYDSFVSPDLRCFAELKRMSRPPESAKGNSGCTHGHGAPGGCDGGGQSLDQEQVDRVVGDVLEKAVQGARQGNERLAESVTDMMDRTEGSESAARQWGRVGANALRGDAVEMEKPVQVWSKWLDKILASLLHPGTRLKFPRKRLAVDWELELDTIMVYRGDESKKRGIVATDTSGSMQTEILNWVAERCGREEGLEITYVSWDAEAHALVDGQPMTGGGGTDVQCVYDWVAENCEVHPDFVLVITDGFMAHNPPPAEHRENYVWLITPGGDGWPFEDYGMDTFILPVND
jgi:hypothetical protein